MAGPALIARQILAWAMRGTKQLSPVKTSFGKAHQYAFHAGKGKPTNLADARRKLFYSVTGKTGMGFKPHYEYRPWAKWAFGSDKTGLGKLGIGQKGRTKALKAYSSSYKHLRKHKGKYGAGVGGAAIWDFLDDD